jgi:hypothetical protein
MMSKVTDMQKQMIAALIESGRCTSEFTSKFMESMSKCVSTGRPISFKQNDILQSMYDEIILGTKTQKEKYVFDFVVIQKQENSKLWILFINGHQYGSPMPKGDAMTVGLWLKENLATIAVDWETSPDQLKAIIKATEDSVVAKMDGDETVPF